MTYLMPTEDWQSARTTFDFPTFAVYVPGEIWRFTILFGLAYGLESAVVSFNRYPQLGIAIVRRCLLGMAATYFDDELSLEFFQESLVTQPGLQLTFRLMGAPPQAAKSFVPTANRHYLGTSVHVGEAFPEGIIRFQPKSSTRSKVLTHLRQALDSGTMDRDTASKLRGDLNWMWSMCAGYVGRLAGPLLTAKQTDLYPCLDADQLRTLAILYDIVASAVPRDIHIREARGPLTRVYTDASFEQSTLRLGWIIFNPEFPPTGGTLEVPPAILDSWNPRKQQIFPGEALAGLITPFLHPTLFKGQDVLWFVDNEAAAVDSKHCESQIFKPPRKEPSTKDLDDEDEDDACSYISEGEPCERSEVVSWGKSRRGSWWRVRSNLREDLIVRSGVSLSSVEIGRCVAGDLFQQKGKPRMLMTGKGQGCIRMPIQPSGWVTADASRAGGPQLLGFLRIWIYPDRGLAHFKDTLRPYFVKGVNHVFLWRFLQLFRTYRGQNEFVHWIGRFEIAQKRLLASWSDLLDLSDLPDVGTADFTAALTAAQQAEMANLPNEDAQRAFQVTLRETTIANRKRDHMAMFPLSDNLMSLIFLVQADLNEQQRERFVSSMNIRQISMPQYTYLQVKTCF
eukprot:s1435_g3.t1